MQRLSRATDRRVGCRLELWPTEGKTERASGAKTVRPGRTIQRGRFEGEFPLAHVSTATEASTVFVYGHVQLIHLTSRKENFPTKL